MPKLRKAMKAILPAAIRGVLRGMLHYIQRVGRWPVILWQVRGITWWDSAVLCFSALAAPVLSMRSIMSWQDPILLRDAEVSVRGVGQFSIRGWTDDLWHVLPWRERAIFKALERSLGPGDVFVDAGANIGVYSVLAARLVGADGLVLAIEMMPDTATILRKHLRVNAAESTCVYQVALSDEKGKCVAATVVAGKYGQATISRESSQSGQQKVNVRTATLDQILQDIESVKLMKMDLEGAERRALAGASASMIKIKNLIYENNGADKQFEDPVERKLKGYSFSIRDLDGNNRIATREC